MSTDRWILMVSVSVAVRRAHVAGLVPRGIAEGLAANGGSTNTLLMLSERGSVEAAVARHRSDETRAHECERIAEGLSSLAAEVSLAGDWAAILEGATAREREAFDRIVRTLSEAHGLVEPGASEADVDGPARPLVAQRASINEWRQIVIDTPGAYGHGARAVTGRIYGDPHFADGCSVTVRATISADERRAEGVDREYELGRPARAPPRGRRDDG